MVRRTAQLEKMSKHVQSTGEEQYVFRFADLTLADRVRKALREEEELKQGLELRFPGRQHGHYISIHLHQLMSPALHRSSLHGCLPSDSGRQGQLTFEGRTYRVDLLDLPTVVESYKTLDDTNLVKTGDIGQVGHTVTEAPGPAPMWEGSCSPPCAECDPSQRRSIYV